MKKRNRQLITLFMTIAIIFSTIHAAPLTAYVAEYDVKAYQKTVTIIVGHATSSNFFFYKNGKRINWSSQAKYKVSDTSVIKVEKDKELSNAFLRGKKEGTAKVTCTYKGHSDTITVKVKKMAAGINDYQTVYVPEGSSDSIGIEASSAVGTVTVKSSNTSVAKLNKTKVEPFYISEGSQPDYAYIDVEFKKQGKATITLKGKGVEEKIKVIVVPKIKVTISDYSYKQDGDKYNYTYKITNHGSDNIVVGSEVGIYAYRGRYYAQMNQGIKKLKKGKSATYTFSTPVENVFPDMGGIETIYIKSGGYCYTAYVDEKGNLDGFRYYGKYAFDAVEYYKRGEMEGVILN